MYMYVSEGLNDAIRSLPIHPQPRHSPVTIRFRFYRYAHGPGEGLQE